MPSRVRDFFQLKKSETIQFNLPGSWTLMAAKSFHLDRKLFLIAAKSRQKRVSPVSQNKQLRRCLALSIETARELYAYFFCG